MEIPSTATEGAILIVPTHERPAFLTRLFEYHGQAGLSVPILVADSSEGESFTSNCAAIDGYRAKGLTIRHLDLRGRSFYQKLHIAVRAAEGYMAIALNADDDFITPSFMTVACELLRDSPATVAVYGHEIQFAVGHDEVYGQTRYLLTNQAVIPNGLTAADRLRTYGRTPSPVSFYNLKRRELWLAITDGLLDLERIDSRHGMCAFFADVLESQLTLASGPVSRVDEVMVFRQMHSNADTVTLRNNLDELDRMVEPSWQQLFSCFSDRVATRVVETDTNLPVGTARQLVAACFWDRVARNLRGWVERRWTRMDLPAPVPQRSLIRRVLGQLRHGARSRPPKSLAQQFLLVRSVIESDMVR